MTDTESHVGVRTLSQEQLESLLAAHQQWLDTNGEKGAKAILDDADLSDQMLHQHLRKADLRLASLRHCNLKQVSLDQTVLKDADFTGSDVTWTSFGGADIENAVFLGAKGIEKERISWAKSWLFAIYDEQTLGRLGFPSDHRARIAQRDFSGYNFELVSLAGVDLSDAKLQSCVFRRAHLRGTILHGANLSGAVLTGAMVDEANLRNASLRGAQLTQASLLSSDLYGADLRDVHGLDVHEVPKSRNWLFAKYDSDVLTQLGLPEKHNERAARKDLSGYDLSRRRLIGCDFSGVNLRRTNLEGASVEDASFVGASLRDATLRGLDLSKHALVADQLGGADLAAASLPSNLMVFPEAIKGVEESSSNAQKVFAAMLLGCLYTWLTIGTTTDVALITNSSSSPLPIIQTAIPIVAFYVVAPIMLLLAYAYFHLYALRLWEKLAKLPAIFPDGRRVDEKIDPWLLNGLVIPHFPQLRGRRPVFWWAQVGASYFLGWWTVPVTLVALWMRYLPRHDWTGTWLHVAVVVASVGVGLAAFASARAVLRSRRQPAWRKLFRGDSGHGKALALRVLGLAANVLIVTAAAYLFWLVSYGAIEGVDPSAYGDYRFVFGRSFSDSRVSLDSTDPRTWVPRTFERFSFVPFAEMQEAVVSTKPEGWTSDSAEAQFVKGANLRGQDLRFARARGAFLVRADLRVANLTGADLFGANLTDADLFGANLTDANLSNATLTRANLWRANLTGAYLPGANLTRADFWGANLTEAVLPDKTLTDADLLFATLTDADLSGANLIGAVLRRANLTGAYLLGANLTDADLVGANLTGAYLLGANLTGANLGGASLTGAILWDANLDSIQWHGIRSVEMANIHEARNMPDGFREWALRNGAVEIASTEAWHSSIRRVEARQAGGGAR